MIDITPYRAEHSGLWDDLVESSRTPHVLFKRRYMEYHGDRFEDCSLILAWKGRPVAVLPASNHGKEVVSHGGLTFGSLVAGADMTVVRAADAMRAAAHHFREKGAARWRVKPLPYIYQVAPADEDRWALHELGAVLERRDVSAAVRTDSPLPYSSERRRAVRRGRGRGIVVAESSDIESFHALLCEVLQARHDVEPVHTARELRFLADSFPDSIKLWIARDADGALLAGTLIFLTKACAHAQYIAVSSQGRDVGALDVLFDDLLVRGMAPWFDFGISNERDGQLNHGLMRQKEGFGARAVAYDRYVVDLTEV